MPFPISLQICRFDALRYKMKKFGLL